MNCYKCWHRILSSAYAVNNRIDCSNARFPLHGFLRNSCNLKKGKVNLSVIFEARCFLLHDKTLFYFCIIKYLHLSNNDYLHETALRSHAFIVMAHWNKTEVIFRPITVTQVNTVEVLLWDTCSGGTSVQGSPSLVPKN